MGSGSSSETAGGAGRAGKRGGTEDSTGGGGTQLYSEEFLTRAIGLEQEREGKAPKRGGNGTAFFIGEERARRPECEPAVKQPHLKELRQCMTPGLAKPMGLSPLQWRVRELSVLSLPPPPLSLLR